MTQTKARGSATGREGRRRRALQREKSVAARPIDRPVRSNPATKLEKLVGGVRTLFGERGVDQLLRILERIVPRGLFHIDVFFVTELYRPVELARRPRGFTVREARSDDLAELLRLFRREPKLFKKRLEAGHIAFACEVKGKLIGMSWMNMGREHEEAEKFCRFLMLPDAVWGYDLFILPEWQISPAAVAMLYFAFDHARKQGRARVYGFASRHNMASLKTHLNFGHEKILKVLVVNVLGLRVHRLRPVNGSDGVETRISFFSTPRIDLAPVSRKLPA